MYEDALDKIVLLRRYGKIVFPSYLNILVGGKGR